MPAVSAPVVATGRRRRLQRLLLAWYRSEARPLPWRSTHDPYQVLVSEIMLQQTQASRVEPVFLAFIRRFPTVEALAAAAPGEVVTAWRGLGYNRRALNLHATARAIVDTHDASVPADLGSLLRLPGVGDYTARAVLAFAFRHDEAPVDTNVARVLTRAVAGAALGRRDLQLLADAMVPAGESVAWNNGLMDLGARYCAARAPRCDACPVAAACAWRAGTAQDPAAPAEARVATRFAGSDRYHRGRLVDALRRGPVSLEDLATSAELGDDPVRLRSITAGLVSDGLAEWSDGRLRLPA